MIENIIQPLLHIGFIRIIIIERAIDCRIMPGKFKGAVLKFQNSEAGICHLFPPSPGTIRILLRNKPFNAPVDRFLDLCCGDGICDQDEDCGSDCGEATGTDVWETVDDAKETAKTDEAEAIRICANIDNRFYRDDCYLKVAIETKKDFYDHFFSPSYYLRKSRRKDFYSQIMARSALNHLVGRIKMPKWVIAGSKKVGRQKKSGGGHSTPNGSKNY